MFNFFVTVFRRVVLKILFSRVLAHLVSSALEKDGNQCVIVGVYIPVRRFYLSLHATALVQLTSGSKANLFTGSAFYAALSTRSRFTAREMSFSKNVDTYSIGTGVLFVIFTSV